MAVANEVPARNTGHEAPMLPGMPPVESDERALIKAHLALDQVHITLTPLKTGLDSNQPGCLKSKTMELGGVRGS